MSVAKRSTIIFACVISVLLGMVVSMGLRDPRVAFAADPASKIDRSGVISLQIAFISIADQLKPSVVYITAERKVAVRSGAPNIEDFLKGFPFGDMPVQPRGGSPRAESQIAKSTGSGVIVRSDGYILTNDHVVGGADRVTVTLNDGREFTGKVMRDQSTDLALVKVEAKGLPAVKLGDSDDVKVGQWAIAIGSPFGLTNTLTVGVVSAISREAVVPDAGGVRGYFGLIQTDASINPGNSGGPLCNIDGEVIGINAVIESPSGGNVGVGFAIPADTARFVMDQLIANGKVVRGYFGLIPGDINPAKAKALGTENGALVQSVSEDTPAGKAGIKPMDVITSIDGKKVDDSLALRRAIADLKPGSNVAVQFVRDGKKQTVQVKVGESGEQTANGSTEKGGKLGLSVQSLTQEYAERLGINPKTPGVLVTSVDADSAAGRSQPPIAVGDVILKINTKPTTNVEQFNSAVSGLKSGDTALILIQRGNRTAIAELTLD